MTRAWILGIVAVGCLGAAAGLAGLDGSARANGLDENRSWQFRTTGQRLENALVLDTIERKKNGYYDGFDTTNNYVTNFAGDQINCTVQASATGNMATNSQSGQAGNASITPAVANNATTTGNDATNTSNTSSNQVNSADTVGSSSLIENLTNSGGNDNSGSDFSIGSDDNNSYSGSSSYSAQDLVNNNQSNDDSTLTSNANNNSNTINVGATSTSGEVNQALNNNQTNSGTQTATVTDSQGCTFTDK